MTTVERAETKVALLKEAVSLTERLHTLETERGEVLGKRAATCRQLRQAGATIAELQDVFGISRSRVQQILHDAAS